MTQATQKANFYWHWLALAAIVCVYLLFAYLTPPGADTLWRLHVARGLWEGQVIYRDMIEVNPPLWFWAGMPAAALGGYPAVVGINLLASLIGIWLFGAFVRLSNPDMDPWIPKLALAIGLFLVNVGEIGQREQAFLLASALWCALAAARMQGKVVPVGLALVATGFAAYGFALKHYFVLVPVAIELLVIWHRRRLWKPFRPETLLLAGLAVIYAFCVFLLTPEFFSHALGLVQASYFGFGPWNTVSPAQRYLALILVCSFAIIPFIAALVTRTNTAAVRAVLLALAVSVGVVMLQQKGWRYHLIGANGLAILTMSLIWQSIERQHLSTILKLFVPIGAAALVFTAFVQPAAFSLRTNGQPMVPVLKDFVAREPRDHHIAILSTAPDNAFYVMARAGRPHWSRHYSMWMMPGLLSPQADAKKETLRIRQRAIVLEEFTADLMCLPPDVIVGEVGYFRNPEPALFDAMAFLTQDPAFTSWMQANYRRVQNVEDYPVWRLLGTKPAPQNCTPKRP